MAYKYSILFRNSTYLSEKIFPRTMEKEEVFFNPMKGSVETPS